MPHMMAQQHLGFYDAIRSGTARTQATLLAALATIGATETMLNLTMAGDGVWTIASNITGPATCTLRVPSGATMSINTGVTVTWNGPIIADNSSWKTGPGTLVRGLTRAAEISRLESVYLTMHPPSGEGVRISTPGSNRELLLSSDQGGNSVAILLLQNASNNAVNWEMGDNAVAQWYVAHPGGLAHLMMNDVGLSVSNGAASLTPAHLLHLQLDDAFKPGDASWDFPSDNRLKTVVRPYTDGLTMLLALPAPVVFTYNGKAQTPVDGREYVGMLGQDVQPVAPYMIDTYQERLDPEDPDPVDILSMNNSSMVYALVNAVRELDTRLQALESVTRQSGSDESDTPHAQRKRRRPAA